MRVIDKIQFSDHTGLFKGTDFLKSAQEWYKQYRNKTVARIESEVNEHQRKIYKVYFE
jgi:transposase